MQKIQWWM